MSTKTAVALLNTRAALAVAGVVTLALVAYLASRKLAAAVVSKEQNLYDPAKKDRLLFGFINIDEPFAVSKRIGCSLPFVNCQKTPAPVPGDNTEQIVRDASRVGSIH